MIIGYASMIVISLIATFMFGMAGRRLRKLTQQRNILYERLPKGRWMRELQDRYVFEDPLEEELASVLTEIKKELDGQGKADR